MERPDLSNIPTDVRDYIEYLESLVAGTKTSRQPVEFPEEKPILEPSEPPTTINLLTITAQGTAKRTPRHLYARQRRGGMGIFDLDAPKGQKPDILSLADENQTLILFTNKARGFRLPVSYLTEAPVRTNGQTILEKIPLDPDESLAVVLPDQATGYVTLVSQKGMVRTLRHHLFGEYLKPGTSFYNFRDFGPLGAASWTPGDADLLIATRQGLAIRFSEKLVTPQGISGMRVDPEDAVVAVTPVRQEEGVFFLGADGKGVVRQMSGFNPNKSAGGSGKLALKTGRLIGAVTVEDADDLFIITELGKIIRFNAGEVPPTEGVIQGVNCIGLRGDEAHALVRCHTETKLTFHTS